ncbi:uncharacterized protein [Palaemon carinicauda]|uniref:uncharacterized protein isoform X2 n=1 Tax=Palaemon carinicauda TaxID=392227 RepID=UPI0035B5F469
MSYQSPLKCQICVEWYDEGARTPKQLPCGHNLCATCILNLLGEPLHGPVNLEPAFPSGRMIRCPVCQRDVSSDQIHTNRILATKISGLVGLESMIITDDKVLETKKLKSIPSTIKPEKYSPENVPQPQKEGQALGWISPSTSHSLKPEVQVKHQENDQPQIGWSLPGIPMHAASAHVGIDRPQEETPFCPPTSFGNSVSFPSSNNFH